MTSLAEIRQKLEALDTRRSGNNTSKSGPTENFPFWNLENGTSAKVRFLPDGNNDNTFFWVEKQIIRIPFVGIKGDNESKESTIDVPCIDMWGESCPIIAETRPWWNDPALEELARKYWKKRTYLFQGLVLDSGSVPDDSPANPIRKFVIGPQIFKIIKSSLLDPDFENIPTDYINGTDFTITKTQNGVFADYSTSKWSRKETALDAEQLASLSEHPLKDLTDYLPRKPSPEQMTAIFEMFEASVDGQLYDPARWAKYYRPYGFDYNDTSVSVPVPASIPAASTPTTDDIPFDMDDDVAIAEKTITAAAAPAPVTETVTADASAKLSPQDILELIRSRNA